MKTAGWLCVGQTEIINDLRTQAYMDNGVVPWKGQACACPAVDDSPYVDPEADEAPWYDADHPESAEFGGFKADLIDISPAASRNVTGRLDEGSSIGGERLAGRIIDVSGWMFASSPAGMWWGQKWLKEILRGQLCVDDCTGGEVSILPFCRTLEGGDYSDDFLTLLEAALVDGPRFTPWGAPEVKTYESQEVHFQIASLSPWLHHYPVASAGASVAGGASAGTTIEAETWGGGTSLTIEVSSESGDAPTDITIYTAISLDGTTVPENRVSPAAVYEIPGPLPPYSALRIDGARRRVDYDDPGRKITVPAFDRIFWRSGNGPGGLRTGSFCWPVVPASYTLAVWIVNGGTDPVTWSVEARKREL